MQHQLKVSCKIILFDSDWSAGGEGCGKSLCLSQVTHWGVKSGWTIIHVPSGELNIKYFCCQPLYARKTFMDINAHCRNKVGFKASDCTVQP